MISVFILVDALGWELVKDRQLLRDVLPYRRELKTVFGFSSAAIPSILTGLLPRDHGHWNLYLYDPARSPFRWARLLRALPSGWINNRFVRKAVSVIGRRVSGTRGYFQVYGIPVEILPFFDVCEKDDIYQPRGLQPVKSVFDLLEDHGIVYAVYSYHQYSDAQAVDRAVSDIRHGAARFYFVYLSELDAFLHRHVQDEARVAEELEKCALNIRRIYEATLAADAGAGFYVFSDHGMTPVRGTYDLMAAVGQLGWRVPRDYLALYDSTMARFWFFDQGARAAIQERLAGLDCGSEVGEVERRQFGIDFADRRFGELIFMMKPGWIIHPSYMGRTPWAGMHGFHPDEPTSSAALMARRAPPLAVQNIWDLFDLMVHEAGLR